VSFCREEGGKSAFFQCGEEAFHPGIVMATAGTAHALQKAFVFKGLPEQMLGELAFPLAE